ncbi:cytochrome P450 monooxygenase [Colletotrichum graminicola]|uniref:Cytochrome P450 monooxygenase n=1 Tax=Colletotrichum graminicola (strain M1.001 / M2 / FGSC 10212) TaxID=645133 RepID=E3QHQ8_COLGM|nr:cytochrome P450 monooxygenase [Colletotrichum graminicola M1.001]EFQ30396.1 cytochrome P450 monooxygenase [Colletotrichum graminicola M1.001]WDK18650.1 cytochrome P450 monooxygenase [Colletotrichum graminicola]
MKNGLRDGLSWAPPSWMMAIVGVLVFLYILRNAALPKPFKGIPYNVASAKRVLGDIPDIGSLFLGPFTRPLVICADPVEAQDISMRRTSEFKRNSKFKDMLGGMIPNHRLTMADDDPRLKKNRELGKDLMLPGFLHEVSGPEVYDSSMRLIELWKQKNRISNGRPFEAAKDIHNLALDVILSAAFNPDPTRNITARNVAHFESIPSPPATSGDQDLPVKLENPRPDSLVKALSTVGEAAGTLFSSSFPRLRSWFIMRQQSMKEALVEKAIMETRELGNAVKRIEAGLPPRCAMDQMLIRERSIAEKEGRSPEYYSGTIKDELLGYLVAGHDTTSAATQWGIKFLTRNQSAQTRLRAELRAAFPSADGPPPVGEIIKTSISYLDAVVEEVLRCCKALPVMTREALVDTQILGTVIPKGTIVMFLSHGPGVLHPAVPVDDSKRSESGKSILKRTHAWDPTDVGDFVPERWLKRDAEGSEVFDSNAGPFMTFGHGLRACFGRRLSYLEMRIVLFLLVWSFEFQELSEELSG